MAVQADTALHVNARLAGLLQQRFAVKVAADGGNQMHIAAQQRQVMRDVPRHAAGGALDIPRVGDRLRIMNIGNSADIHIHRAQRDAVLLLGKDVAFALDGPLTREVHNMRGHAGAANLQNIGNLMLLN